MEVPAESHSFDDAPRSLGHTDRHSLLVALLDHNPQNPTEAVLDGANGDPDRVRLALEHVHLPKLEEEGLIEWDRDTNDVSKGPRWGDIDPLLRTLLDHEHALAGDAS